MTDIKPKWVLAATILASGMSFLLGSAVTVALPRIQQEFNTTIAGIQWIISSYILTTAILILISGSLGDHFGRKKIFSYGILVFTLGALLSGFARSLFQLISYQVILGIGAAMMVPGSLAIINICFPIEKRGKAIGLWSGFSGGLATLGPLLGGFLVDTFNWPAVFFAVVPLGILTFIITKKFVPESKDENAKGIDWMGTFYIAFALLGISLALIRGPDKGWLIFSTIFSFTIGIATLILFIFHERRSRKPLIPLKLFKNKNVVGANIATFLLYFALQGLIFFLILNFQQFQDYSATLTGVGLLPSIIIITFLSGPAGGLTDKIGTRIPLILGPLIVAFGMGLMILPGVEANYFISFLPGLILFGLGMALVIPAITKSALSVSEKYSGVSSGLNNAVSRVAFLMAIAIMGAIVLSLFSLRLETELNSFDEKDSILDQSVKFGAIEIPDSFPDKIAAEKAIDNAFVYSFRWAMGIIALLALLSALVSYVMVRE
jgi:EmrB/QacA subfamily drug resistance transporter